MNKTPTSVLNVLRILRNLKKYQELGVFDNFRIFKKLVKFLLHKTKFNKGKNKMTEKIGIIYNFRLLKGSEKLITQNKPLRKRN